MRAERQGARYQHSGEVSASGLLMGLAVGLGSASFLAVPYAYATIWIPIVYLNLLCTLFVGIIPGMLAAMAGRRYGLQAPAAYLAIGILTGLVGLYSDWVYWLYALLHHQHLLFNPGSLVAVASLVMDHGTWGLSHGGAVSGWALGVVWAVEGAYLIGAPVYFCYNGIRTHICCPKCQTWFDQPARTLPFALPGNPKLLQAQVASADFSGLAALQGAPKSATDLLTVDAYHCPKCRKFACLSLTQVKITRKKDDTSITKTTLVDKVLLSPEDLDQLLAQLTPPAGGEVAAA